MADHGQRDESAHNRAFWAVVNEQVTDRDAEAMWARTDLSWGLFRQPEAELGVLGDPAGVEVLEIGCGTAFFSAWLARAGARPVALDQSSHQLATAARCRAAAGATFGLVQAEGERLPFAAGSFDLVVSEYGAGAWCDPRRWLPEAARVLRPGGRLAFLTNSVLTALCVPTEAGYATEQLQRPQRDLFRVAWPDGGIEYHPSHGTWIALLRRAGFVVDALHELYPPVGADTHEHYEIVTADWAQRWPAEELWVAHRPD